MPATFGNFRKLVTVTGKSIDGIVQPIKAQT